MAKRKFRKLTESDRDAIVMLYQTGRAARDIAQFMKFDVSTIHKVLRDKGIAAHYPARAENARLRHVCEKRSAAIRTETPETESAGQITFDDLEKTNEPTPDFEKLNVRVIGDEFSEIIYKAVYNGVIDAFKKI